MSGGEPSSIKRSGSGVASSLPRATERFPRRSAGTRRGCMVLFCTPFLYGETVARRQRCGVVARKTAGGGIPPAIERGSSPHDNGTSLSRKHPHPEGQGSVSLPTILSISLDFPRVTNLLRLEENTPHTVTVRYVGVPRGSAAPPWRELLWKGKALPWPLLERAGGGLFRERALLGDPRWRSATREQWVRRGVVEMTAR